MLWLLCRFRTLTWWVWGGGQLCEECHHVCKAVRRMRSKPLLDTLVAAKASSGPPHDPMPLRPFHRFRSSVLVLDGFREWRWWSRL